VLDIPGPGGLSVKVAGNPLKMSGNAHTEHIFPPQLGQDTRAVLKDRLGMSDAEVDRLVKAGVLGEVSA
jgi:crotonobetainyl-CoA:carnitine CoA-transferase CaiB-like acyl-CoA transferase